MCRLLDKKQDAPALTQEIWIIRIKTPNFNMRIFRSPNTGQPNTAIVYTPRHIKTQPLQHLCASYLAAVKVKCYPMGKTTEFVIASIYLSKDAITLTPSTEFEKLLRLRLKRTQSGLE